MVESSVIIMDIVVLLQIPYSKAFFYSYPHIVTLTFLFLFLFSDGILKELLS